MSFDPNEHIGFCDGRSGIEPTIDFDYAEIDAALGILEAAPEDVRAEAAELFKKLLIWIWSGRGKQPASFGTAQVRFLAICSGIRPDLVAMTYSEIADKLGVTKQAISKASLNFADKFGQKFMRSRNKDGRKAMSRAQAENHWRRKNHGTPPP